MMKIGEVFSDAIWGKREFEKGSFSGKLSERGMI
jgi:hypothetical protein